MTSTRLMVTGLVAAIAVIAAGPAAATVIAPVDGAPVAQLDGRIVWDQADGHGAHRLYTRGQDGTVAALPIRPQRLAFDVSLGSDARGRPFAVYSRCSVGRQGWPKRSVVPGSCDLYGFDFASGRERPLREANSPDASEVAPSLDRGVLVFARNRVLSAKPPHDRTGLFQLRFRTFVYIRRLGSRGASRRVLTIPGHDYWNYPQPGRDADVSATAVSERHGVAAASYDPVRQGTTIYYKAPGRPVHILARGGIGEENYQQLDSPSFAGRYLYWSYANTNTDLQRPNGWVLRRDLQTDATLAARAPGYLDAVAADSRRPATALIVSSFSAKDSDTGKIIGTDAVQTLDTPAWVQPPRSAQP